MTPHDALIELLERIGASGTEILVSDYELSQWPNEAVTAMKSQELITKARPGSSAICPGCERECVMPVHTLPLTKRSSESFIVCDKRSDINRVPVSIDRLTQWQCSIHTICAFVANNLGLRFSGKASASANFWEIGIATGNKHSQMLCLQADSVLTLIAGKNDIPLTEVVSYRDDAYSLDDILIRQLVDSASTSDNRYTPTNAKREARKLNTQAMYKSWQKAYRDLKKKHSNMSEVWYSQQISKMDIANGRNPSTIKKHML